MADAAPSKLAVFRNRPLMLLMAGHFTISPMEGKWKPPPSAASTRWWTSNRESTPFP